jgi:hypothetical protein
MGMPDGEECRLSVFSQDRRLADYTPDWGPSIALPDGGAVGLLDWTPSLDRYNQPRDKIVITGSALRIRAHEP